MVEASRVGGGWEARVTNAGSRVDKRFTASHGASQASGSDEKDGVAQTQCGVRGCRGVSEESEGEEEVRCRGVCNGNGVSGMINVRSVKVM